MKYFRTAALATTAFFALMATSVSANAATCSDQTVSAMRTLFESQGATMTPDAVKEGVTKVGVDPIVAKVSPKVDEVCRPYVAKNAKAYAGLGQPAEPAPKQVATEASPISTATPQPAAEVVAAEAAARRAEAAAAGAEHDRDAAAARLEQTKARPGVSRAEVASATNTLRAAEAKLTEMRRLEALTKASANASAKSAGDSATSAGQSAGSATAAVGSATTAKSEADKAEAAAKRAEATAVWSFWDWFWWVPILIGMGGIVLWVKKTRRSNEQADKKFATKTEIVTIEVRGANFEHLQLLKDGDALPLEFLASNGKVFLWHFGRKDGKWFTPTGGTDHNPQHDLITDPAKTIQKWVRKGQITI